MREHGRRRFEADLGAGPLGLADGAQGILRDAVLVFLLVELAVAPDEQVQVLGEGVHHRHTHAVQATGDFVGVVVELTAGMEDGHDDLGRRTALFLVHIYRDTAPIVFDGDRLIFMDDDLYFAAIASKCFVDGVIHHLEDHVVKARAVIGVADVHAGAFAYSVEALQDLDIGGVVALGIGHGRGLFLQFIIIRVLPFSRVPRGTNWRHSRPETAYLPRW